MDELAAAAAVLATAADPDIDDSMDTEQRPMETADSEGGATSITSGQVSHLPQPTQCGWRHTELGLSSHNTSVIVVAGIVFGPSSLLLWPHRFGG